MSWNISLQAKPDKKRPRSSSPIAISFFLHSPVVISKTRFYRLLWLWQPKPSMEFQEVEWDETSWKIYVSSSIVLFHLMILSSRTLLDSLPLTTFLTQPDKIFNASHISSRRWITLKTRSQFNASYSHHSHNSKRWSRYPLNILWSILPISLAFGRSNCEEEVPQGH